jgi:hypothetical protein
MKVILRITLGAIMLFPLFFASCTQPEGFGGSSHIKGKLLINYYNDDFSLLLNDTLMPAPDEDVFIHFGDSKLVGEDVSTSHTGDFQFEYLWPGKYTLYYYSDDTTGISPKRVPIIKEITLGKGETLDLGNLFTKRKLDWDEGTSSITGIVWVINFRNSSSWPQLIEKDYTPAQEQEIYLQYGNHLFYDERIRTSHDGTFTFTNLIKGKYLIFLYSEDRKGGTEKVLVKKEIEITHNHQHVVIQDTIVIDKL